jgi:tRNA threonylcarbamoyladenosine biosynthesis protein TsaE
MTKRVVASVREMHELAAELVKQTRGGEVWFLIGELGAGKTTFVQGVTAALGITERVTSPTFTIVGEYSLPPDKGGQRGVSALAHADLYRLDEKTAASDPAVQDVLERAGEAGRLTVIEWADRLGEAVPAGTKRLRFQHGEHQNERVVDYDFV